MVDSESLSRLLLVLYEGAATPARLQDFLIELTKAINARGAAFREQIFEDDGNVSLTAASLFVSVGYSEEALREYTEYFHSKDIFVQRVLQHHRSADCGVSQLLITEHELRKTEIFSDYMRRFEIGPMMWAKLSEDPNYVAGMSFHRLHEFGQSELEMITALIPHIRQTLQLSRTLRTLEASNAALSRSLEEMEIAISMVRQDGSILRSTEGAERLLAAGNGIGLQKGRLSAAFDSEQRTLNTLIEGACRTGAGHGLEYTMRTQSKAAGNTTVRSWTAQSGGAMLITRKPPLRPLQVIVSPFCSGLLMHEPQATALIQFSDPSSIPRSRSSVLRALYALTPTESRLADLLLQGLKVSEAADRMKITLETTRFQLKRVLAKTGAGRQSELMRLMLSLPGAP